MIKNTIPFTGNTATTIVLALSAALLVSATLSGRRIAFISTDRAALIALLVIGMAMCSRGIGRVAITGDWAHPLSILGYVLGALALFIVIWIFIGKPLPWIASAREAIIAVTILGIAKFALSALHRLLN